MKRTFFAVFMLLAAGPLMAQPASAPPPALSPVPAPYEIVQDDIDIEAAPDGRSWEVEEVHYRALTSQGVEALQKFTRSFMQGYEALVVNAYTLKKDGRRIDIPPGSMLQGHGETTATPGFEDTRTLTVVFPDLEVGDQVVIITQTRQIVPWFADVFAFTASFSLRMAVKEASIAFTSQSKDSSFHIDTNGLEADPPLSAGGKTRHVWHYHNDNPLAPEPDTTSDLADEPHVAVTTMHSWSDVAGIYSKLFKDRAEVTPEIASLAKSVTAGEADRRAQARRLYDWVSSNIRYINIVLGAGGFLPHKAADVLRNGYGDCKDHVMLLEALLAAKGIKSSAVLIRAGERDGESFYKLPPAPTPFTFDHLITYVPEFQMFLDSTARYASFGTLPHSDAGKEVVIVETGKTAIVPPVSAANSSIAAFSNVIVNPDGSADTETKYTAVGASAADMRALMAEMAPDRDGEFFRRVLGPGSDGRFERGNPDELGDTYEFAARYHTAHFANIPGPGALPAALAFKPFSFSTLIGLNMPQDRRTDYACSSGTYREETTATLPPHVSIIALPGPKSLAIEGMALQTAYEQPAPNIVKQLVTLKIDRAPVCRAADYARIRPGLTQMIGALFAQTLYK